MKKLFILLMACALVFPVIGQESEEVEAVEPVEAIEAVEAPEKAAVPAGDTVNVIGRVEVIETPEQTRVTLGKNEVLIVEENGDTVIVGLGSKGLSIVEGNDGVVINVIDMDEKKSSHKKKHKKRFNPHWAGLQFGLNNYLTPDFSLVLPPGEEFMDLNTGMSWAWNINVADIGIGFGTSYVGLGTGLGFEFINYNFDGQNGIMKDPATGNIVEYVPPYAGFITKSKMNIAYITAPIMLEFQIPTGRKRFYISTGVLGSLKMWSNTKIKYTEAGDNSKEKNKSDFNLSPVRWGVVAQVGYGGVGVFANYYMTSLFKPGKGPELYPFSMGLAFTF